MSSIAKNLQQGRKREKKFHKFASSSNCTFIDTSLILSGENINIVQFIDSSSKTTFIGCQFQ
jgi:hypothetical protein